MATQPASQAYTPDNVAKYLIYLASQEFVGDNQEREGMSNLKLQKMLYFAQAYYLAKHGRPLFKGKIEAWEYGPVVPTVYRKFRKYGSNSIIFEKDDSSISEEDKEQLKKVWKIFGGYSSSRLVNITHTHEPWKKAYASESKVISNQAIKTYYTPLLGK